MTCNFNDSNNTSLVLVDFGDEDDDFSIVEPMLVFMQNGKEVPISTIAPSIKAIDIQEDPLLDGYNLTVTTSDGNATSKFCHRLVEVFNRICSMVRRAMPAEPVSVVWPALEAEAATEPAEAVEAQVTDDTTPATDAAQEAPTPIPWASPSKRRRRNSCNPYPLMRRLDDAEAAIDKRKMKRILSAANAIIKRHDKYAKLKREGAKDLAEVEYGDIVTLGASLQMEAFGCIPMDVWDTINTQVIEAIGEQRTPKFYAHAAAEYIKYIVASTEPAQTATEPAQAASIPPVDNDTAQATEPAQTAPETVGEPFLYMENCFTSFIINSAGERIQIPDLKSAMAWAAEHTDASFGDINVAVWRFTHKDNLGNFEKRCIVVDWNGQNEWFFQLDDFFFELCWADMLAMGHTLHPMNKERRAVPVIENAVDFVDVTDYYFPVVSPTPSDDVVADAHKAANLFECAHHDHQQVKMWTARMPRNGNTKAIDETQATIEKFRKKRDDAISQAIQLIDPSIADPAQVRQAFKDTDDAAQACMSVRDILNGYICNAWVNDEEAIRRMRECGEAAMILRMKEVSGAHEKFS
ncbi:MAG: hypothetical protein K2M42_09300 [Oscillospiraceae bacterium]|nr:hypothetical protein [Oscillospiraceae bacterium]